MIGVVVDELPSISLADLNDRAELQVRRDRKYIVSAEILADVLRSIDESVNVLDIEGRRWFGYESLYFDTDGLDAYRMAAHRRPSRFKVRARTYLDSGAVMLEVKQKDARGRTQKHRAAFDGDAASLVSMTRRHASDIDVAAPYAAELHPVLTTTYERMTIVLPESGVRTTIDRGYAASLIGGRRTGLKDDLIVETKTAGPACTVDRLLWISGIRPVKLSKYSTGMAVLRPDLPANRWHRVLGRLIPPTSTPSPPRKRIL